MLWGWSYVYWTWTMASRNPSHPRRQPDGWWQTLLSSSQSLACFHRKIHLPLAQVAVNHGHEIAERFGDTLSFLGTENLHFWFDNQLPNSLPRKTSLKHGLGASLLPLSRFRWSQLAGQCLFLPAGWLRCLLETYFFAAFMFISSP